MQAIDRRLLHACASLKNYTYFTNFTKHFYPHNVIFARLLSSFRSLKAWMIDTSGYQVRLATISRTFKLTALPQTA